MSPRDRAGQITLDHVTLHLTIGISTREPVGESPRSNNIEAMLNATTPWLRSADAITAHHPLPAEPDDSDLDAE